MQASLSSCRGAGKGGPDASTRRTATKIVASRVTFSREGLRFPRGPLDSACAQLAGTTARPAVASVVSRRRGAVQVRAAAAADLPQRKVGLEYWIDKAVLGALFGGWYLANIVFNIYNKQALGALPQPMTMTVLQFGVGSLLALFFWAAGLVKRPTLTPDLIKSVSLLAVVHTMGNLLTNMSLGAVSVSFTHTIKAMEPFFSVILSAMFLGDVPNPTVVATLLPIVGGVALASMSEASFNWLGFLSAMGSNITFQSRNVLSKKLMLKKDGDGLDNISMFSLITIASFLMLTPISLAVEGWSLTPAALAAKGVANPSLVMQHALIAALCFHTYQQVSYMILSRVSPVTHSIGNCVKRVVVIVAAIVFFSTPVNTQNAIGTSIALGGVFAYGQVKRMQRKRAEEECQVKWDKEEECVVPDMTIDEPTG